MGFRAFCIPGASIFCHIQADEMLTTIQRIIFEYPEWKRKASWKTASDIYEKILNKT